MITNRHLFVRNAALVAALTLLTIRTTYAQNSNRSTSDVNQSDSGFPLKPYCVLAWDEKFAGGFKPGNSPEANQKALDALWEYLDSSKEEFRYVSFLPGVHQLKGSFSPSGRGVLPNKRS